MSNNQNNMWPILFKTGVVGIVAWAGVELTNFGKEISHLTTALSDGKEARLEAQRENREEHKIIMIKLDSMVPRAEYEKDILAIKTQIAAINVELSKLKEHK